MCIEGQQRLMFKGCVCLFVCYYVRLFVYALLAFCLFVFDIIICALLSVISARVHCVCIFVIFLHPVICF